MKGVCLVIVSTGLRTERALISPEQADALASSLAGDVLLPGSEGYDQARTVWNGMVDHHPAIIARCKGVADVMAAVNFGRELDLDVSIRGGGHNVAGHAVSDGGMMIDMSAMRSVAVDPSRRTARVEGGATWADMDRETTAFGLATTGGVISDTGVAGLTLGGGIGWLVGKHGMSIDNVLSVELVTAAGEFVTANESQHADLFWALRGGGGNFGVVTAFEFQLHPVGLVTGGLVLYPASQAREVLEFYRTFTSSLPDELIAYYVIASDPESGARVCGMHVCFSGDPDEADDVFASLRAFGEPIFEQIEVMPYQVWQSANDALFPAGRHFYWKSNLYRAISGDLADAIVEYGVDAPTAECTVAIENYHGAFNRVDPTATAYPHRDINYQVMAIGATDLAAYDEAVKQWSRSVFDATEPYSKGSHFLNFNVFDGADRAKRVRAGYGLNWERLVEVKRRYDPTNFFKANNNISPESES